MVPCQLADDRTSTTAAARPYLVALCRSADLHCAPLGFQSSVPLSELEGQVLGDPSASGLVTILYAHRRRESAPLMLRGRTRGRTLLERFTATQYLPDFYYARDACRIRTDAALVEGQGSLAARRRHRISTHETAAPTSSCAAQWCAWYPMRVSIPRHQPEKLTCFHYTNGTSGCFSNPVT